MKRYGEHVVALFNAICRHDMVEARSLTEVLKSRQREKGLSQLDRDCPSGMGRLLYNSSDAIVKNDMVNVLDGVYDSVEKVGVIYISHC